MRVLHDVSRSLRRMLPTCQEATRIASDRLDRGASLVQRARLAVHLVICVWCRRYVRQIAFLRRAMQRLAEPASDVLPAEARERTKAALRQAATSAEGPFE